MRFHIGSLPSAFVPHESWRPLREPSPWVMQLCAVPIGFGLALAVGAGWLQLVTASFGPVRPQEFVGAMLSLGGSLLVLIAVHELIHAATHPGWGRSDASVVGVWPSRMLFYGHYTGRLSRNRFLAILAMPFLVLSVLPLALAALGVVPAGFGGFLVAWCSTWNALFSCGDVFAIALVLAQIPADSVVQNDGWRTFWKPANEA
jgi:hypothetical protein